MKVLIVAFWFPPSNVVGAIRVGKLARFLHRGGHDVRVLTTDVVADSSLPVEIPAEHIIYTEFHEGTVWLNRLVRLVRGRRAAASRTGTDAPQVSRVAASRSFWDSLRHQYYGLIHIPDRRIGWLKTGAPAGRRLIEQWRPDIIVASAPPFTSLILARRLSREYNIPWVADFRDLWVDDPYYSEPGWRRRVDALLERIIMQNAAALVTISPSCAEQLRRRHGKPTAVIYNGYAEEDVPPMQPGGDGGEVVIIRHTGTIYRGFRDPSPVFAAIGLLPSVLRSRVMIEFCGDTGGDGLLDLAAAQGVQDRVAIRPRVPYREALELQKRADVLLLLQWNDVRDKGNLPGKLFEYFYARRPILFIGYESGIAAQMVRERNAGFISNSPERIRDQLLTWIEEKPGRIADLDPSVSSGLSRDEQYQKLELVLSNVVKGVV